MDQLYDSFADIPSLEKQTAKILSMFNQVEQGVLKLKEMGIKINTTSTTAGVAGLTDEFEKQNETIKKQQAELVKLANKLAALNTEEAKKIASTQEVTKLVKSLNTEEAKTSLLRQGAYVNLLNQKQANKELAKDMELRLKIQRAEEGSQQKLALQYEKAVKIINRLSEAQRQSSKGQLLQKFALETQNKLKEIEGKVGNFRRNVGNYANSLGPLFDKVTKELERLKKESQELERTRVSGLLTAKQLEENAAAIDKNTKAQAELNQVMAATNKEGQSFNRTVRAIGFQFGNMVSAGNQTEEFLDDFKKDAAKAKDAANDLNDELKALSSDTYKLDLVVGAIGSIASAAQAAAGAAALFGEENEDVQKSIQKLVAIQSVANGVREVANDLTKHGTAANKLYNAVIAQGTILFGKGATAAARFGAALKLTGIGLLITLITTLIVKMIDFGDGTDEATEKTKRLNDAIKDLNDTIREQTELVGQATSDNLRLLKAELQEREAAGAGAQELFELRKKIADEEAKVVDEQIENIMKRAEAEDFNYTAGQTGIKGEEALIRAREHYNEAYAGSLKRLEALQKEKIRILELGATDEADKLDKEIEVETQRKELYKQRADDYTNIGQKLLDTLTNQDTVRLAEQKRINDAEKKAAFDLFMYRQELIKKQAEADSSDDSPYSAKAKMEAAIKAAEAEQAIINRQRQEDLSNEDLTATQRKLINEKADNDILDSRLNLSNRILQIRIQDLRNEKALAQQSSDDFDAEMERRFTEEQEKRQAVFEKGNNEDRKRFAEQNKINEEAFKEGRRTKEQYDKEKLNIELNFQEAVLNSQVQFYKEQIELLKASGKDTTEMEASLAEAEAAILAGRNARKQQAVDDEKAMLEQIAENYRATTVALQETFVNVLGGFSERRKAQLQEEIDMIEERKKAEIDAINASGDADEKKAARVKVVEAKAQADREHLERKQRQIDRQRAIIERGFKAFQIITDTITSVNKIKGIMAVQAAIPNPVGVALAQSQLVLAIASGAASLTSLLAAPLPKFAKGTESSPEGLAVVAERGREIGIERGGKTIVWNKPQLTYLKQGTKILPNQVTEDIINTGGMSVNRKGELQMVDKSIEKDMLNELKEIKRKQNPIYIFNNQNIESTVYYQQQMKH